MSKTEHEEVVTLLKELVVASNRTNHAVRAIVRPIYIQLITYLLLLPLIAFYAFTGENGWLVVIGAVALAGTAISIAALASELKSSNIPYDFYEELVRDYESQAADSNRQQNLGDDAAKEDILSASERSDWVMAGKPGLASWDGLESFAKWLKDNR